MHYRVNEGAYFDYHCIVGVQTSSSNGDNRYIKAKVVPLSSLLSQRSNVLTYKLSVLRRLIYIYNTMYLGSISLQIT